MNRARTKGRKEMASGRERRRDVDAGVREELGIERDR